MSRRDDILSKISSVPALPRAAANVIGLLQDPQVGVAEVMKIVEYDPGLTSNVLRLANSAYFGGSQEIVSLRDAGVRLGVNRVFQLIMTSAVAPLASQPVRGYGLAGGELLEHVIAVAIGAERMAGALGKPPPAHAFTTGLLHDLGKLVLCTFIEVDPAPILKLAFQEQMSFEQAERHVLGIDHAEVGGALLEMWNLPAGIVDGVRMHHRPVDLEGDTFVVDLVHVADNLALECGLGTGIDGLNYRPCEEVAQRIGLKASTCEAVVCSMISDLDDLRVVFHLKPRRQPNGAQHP